MDRELAAEVRDASARRLRGLLALPPGLRAVVVVACLLGRAQELLEGGVLGAGLETRGGDTPEHLEGRVVRRFPFTGIHGGEGRLGRRTPGPAQVEGEGAQAPFKSLGSHEAGMRSVASRSSRSLRAREAVRSARRARHAQLPVGVPGVFVRVARPSPRRSWSCTMAVRARLVQAVRTMVDATVFPSPPVAALKRARAPRRGPATSRRRCRCRGSRGRRRRSRERPRVRGTSPTRSPTGAPACPAGRTRRGGRAPRRSPTPDPPRSGAAPRARHGSRRAAPPPVSGPRRPSAALEALAGISQALRKPMKWSMRTASNSSSCRRIRARHQRKPSAR